MFQDKKILSERGTLTLFFFYQKKKVYTNFYNIPINASERNSHQKSVFIDLLCLQDCNEPIILVCLVHTFKGKTNCKSHKNGEKLRGKNDIFIEQNADKLLHVDMENRLNKLIGW